MNDFPDDKKTSCQAVLAAVKIIGDKWSPLIINYIRDNPKRFGQLQSETGVNPRTLSSRLIQLEESGIINKKVFSEVPPKSEYSLTDKGRNLLPILTAMEDWCKQYPAD